MSGVYTRIYRGNRSRGFIHHGVRSGEGSMAGPAHKNLSPIGYPPPTPPPPLKFNKEKIPQSIDLRILHLTLLLKMLTVHKFYLLIYFLYLVF
jgi:hypothetical protein